MLVTPTSTGKPRKYREGVLQAGEYCKHSFVLEDPVCQHRQLRRADPMKPVLRFGLGSGIYLVYGEGTLAQRRPSTVRRNRFRWAETRVIRPKTFLKGGA